MPPATAKRPLFPMPVPIIAVSGAHGSGKTLLGLCICPQETLVFDNEESSATYQGIGVKRRVSMARVMAERHPDGYRPLQVFEWWREEVRKIEPGEYRVVMIDPGSIIETGIAEYVRANPSLYRVTARQIEAKPMIFLWPHVKATWNQILQDLAARCECVYIVMHLKQEFSGDTATGRKIPRGLETLEELASLYLILDRKPEPDGLVPHRPHARILKSRLAHFKFDPDTGEVTPIPALPPRIPVCTVSELRAYMIRPDGVDYRNLKPEECTTEDRLSEDDKLLLEAQKAEAMREESINRLAYQQEVEKARRHNEERMARASAEQVQTLSQQTVENAGMTPGNGLAHAAAQTEANAAIAMPELLSAQQLEEIKALHGNLMANGNTQEQWKAILSKRRDRHGKPITSARELSPSQAEELISKLRSLPAAAAPVPNVKS